VVSFTVTATAFGVVADVRNARQPAEKETVVRVRTIEFTPQGDAPRERIGEVRVVLTKAAAQHAFDLARTAAFATLVLVLAVLYFATFLLIRQLVHKPIQRLEEMVDQIAAGDLAARCTVESGDEVGRLAARINVMAMRLENSTESLRESERKYRGTIENSLEGIFILDRHGVLCEANPAMAHLLRFADVASLMAAGADASDEGSARAPCVPFTSEQTDHLFALYRENGKIAGLEIQVTQADGSKLWCLLNARGTRDSQDGALRLEGQMTDVSARKEVVESLTRHRDELEREISERERTERDLRESRESLRLLSAHQESIREEERRQIAMTIHDELGQLLTAIKMNVALLRLLISQGAASGDKLGEMGELVERTIRVVRNVASHLRPAALNYGLVPALEWLVQDFSRHSPIACRFELQGREPVLSDDRATAVFRIVQEALTNIGRHARASQVVVMFRGGEEGFDITVTDDGCGFDVSQAARGDSYGLQGMRERARIIGGELHVSSSVESGSRVHLSVGTTALDDPERRS
jgi:signal transduction histidine kinase